MRLSVSLRSAYAYPDPRDGVKAMVARAAAARRAGLDALFVGDHHGVTGFYQNSPVLGRLLGEWDGDAGALYLLPLWHPVLVAEQVATLAAMTPGRFILQCAIGGGADQFGALGVDVAERVARFEAGLPIVRRLLAGEAVTSDGPYRLDRVRIGPVPREPVQVWIGARARRAIDRAARMGDAWLAGPDLTFDEAAAQIAWYRERCSAHGTDAQAVAIRRDVHVGANPTDAAAVAAPVIAGGYRGFDPSALVVGDTAEVVDRLAAYGDLGFTEVVVRHLADDETEVLASFARLGEVRSALA